MLAEHKHLGLVKLSDIVLRRNCLEKRLAGLADTAAVYIETFVFHRINR